MNALNQQVSEALNAGRLALAVRIVAREFVRRPELEQRYGKIGREKCLQDAGYHLAYLAQSIDAGNPGLFADYLGWAKIMLGKRGIPGTDLVALLETMKEALPQELVPELSRLACDYVETGIRQLPQLPTDVPCCISQGTPLAARASEYLQALLRGERHVASKLIMESVQTGTPVSDLYLQVFQRTQYEIGRLWQVNQISVAQEHYCTAATQLIMSQLYPYIFGSAKTHGTVVATCVSGDLHELGARMVSDFFEMAGWHTHYLGANMPTQAVVQTMVQLKATLLAISATITYHVRTVEALIAAVRRSPECRDVKVLVGGYPFNIAPDLWRGIGADGSATDALEAIALANRICCQPNAA